MTPSELLELGKKRADELKLYSIELNKMPEDFNIAQPFFIASDIHKLLGAGVEIVGNVKNIDGGSTQQKHWTAVRNTGETHTALAIGIKPLKVDTAESLLREFVEHWEKEWVGKVPRDVFERARALLEGGG